MRTIYLLRHCETEPSAKKRCIGVTDVGLSKSGVRQAQSLRKYFANKNIRFIFCSGASRSAKTAEILSGGKTPIRTLDALHEIDMGDWDGMYFDDIKLRYPDEYRRRGLDIAGVSPPNGENFADCRERALNALRRIVQTTHGDVVIVTHAGFNRSLLCALLGMDLNCLFCIPQPFGCVNILSEQDGLCVVRETGILINAGPNGTFNPGKDGHNE